MNDGEPTKETSPIVALPNPPSVAASYSDPASSTQAEIRKELGEFERISIQIQRRMLWVTVVVAIITGAYVAISYLMYKVMDDQLADGRAGGADQQIANIRLYRLFKNQSESLATLAETNADLADANADIAASANSAANAAEISTKNSAKLVRASELVSKSIAKSADVAAVQLERTDRPTLSVKLAPYGPVEPTPCGMEFHVAVSVINIGISPATNVQIFSSIIVRKDPAYLLGSLRRECELADFGNKGSEFPTIAIPPGETHVTQPRNTTLLTDFIKANIECYPG